MNDRLTCWYSPTIAVQADPDGSNPRIVGIDWADSFSSGTLEVDGEAHEVWTGDDEPPTAGLADLMCGWMDDQLAAMTKAIIKATAPKRRWRRFLHTDPSITEQGDPR